MKKVKFAAMQLANVEKQESSTLPDPLLGPQVVRIFSQQVDLENIVICKQGKYPDQ